MDIKICEGVEESEELTVKVKLCDICHKSASKYTCPKCNIVYCTSECYSNIEKHLNCSEIFYRDQVFSELKGVKIDQDHVEDKKKIFDIINRVQNEDNDNDDDNDDDLLTLQVDNIDLNDEKTCKKLVQFYEKELYGWKPWWKFEENDLIKQTINKFLIKNASTITISSTILHNKFIFYDLIQLFYVYAALTYKYQLELNLDETLIEEFVLDFMNIENCVLKRNLKVDMTTRIRLILSNLEATDDENLKDVFNKEFLYYLIDDLSSIIKFKARSVVAISHIYDCLKLFCRKFKAGEVLNELEDVYNDQPFNVFYLNKEKKWIRPENNENDLKRKKEPIKIISNIKRGCKENVEDVKSIPNSRNNCLNDAKMLLKRFEFYYQWLKTSQNEDILKESNELLNLFSVETRQEEMRFKAEKEAFSTFLPKLRQKILQSDTQKKTLIEEVN